MVVYFYPKDFTPGCTAEAKAFSQDYRSIVDEGAEVVGISSDSQDKHEAFAQECEVAFPLLSDSGGKVRAAYGAKGAFGLVPGRVTFVVDKQGVIRKIFSSQMQPRKHVGEALEALKRIAGEEPGRSTSKAELGPK